MRSDHPFSLLDRYKIHMIGSDPIIGDANSLAIFIPQGFGESGNGLLSSNHWGTEAGKNGWDLRRTGSSGSLHGIPPKTTSISKLSCEATNCVRYLALVRALGSSSKGIVQS